MGKYKVESRVDGKTEPKADGTVANDLHSILSLCDVLAIQYYPVQSAKTMLEYMCRYLNKVSDSLVRNLLNIGSIRIYILTTGVVSNETNIYVRMYIEEFILVDIWIHWS